MELIIMLFAIFSRPDLADFIQSDNTNEIPYSADFNCRDYTAVFVENANDAGFDAFPVGVGFYSADNLIFHEFVGINNEDELLWLEPQTDKFYIVAEAGENLCYAGGECFGILAFVYNTP